MRAFGSLETIGRADLTARFRRATCVVALCQQLPILAIQNGFCRRMDSVGARQGNGDEFQEIESIENGRFSTGIVPVGGCICTVFFRGCGRRPHLGWSRLQCPSAAGQLQSGGSGRTGRRFLWRLKLPTGRRLWRLSNGQLSDRMPTLSLPL